MNLQKTVLLFLLASGSVSISTFAPSTPSPITEAPVTKSPASNGITEAPASNGITEAPVTKSPASNGITEAPVTQSPASNTLAPVTTSSASNTLAPVTSSNASNTLAPTTSPAIPFTCTTKEEYLAEMKATHSLCGIKNSTIGWKNITIDTSKACQPACLDRTKAIVSACNITQVGGDGDEATVSAIQNACNPFTCTTKEEYLAEMKATHSMCGIKNSTIDTSKACQPACLQRAEAIASACNITHLLIPVPVVSTTASVAPWGNHVVDEAFDGLVDTYYDANGRGSVVKACLASETKIGKIRFHPRPNVENVTSSIHADRMINGVWRCDSHSQAIATTLSVTKDTWNEIQFTPPLIPHCTCISFTFSSTGDYGSVAEIEIIAAADEITVSAIKNACSPTIDNRVCNHTTTDEMTATLAVCGIAGLHQVDKSKACPTACRQQVEAIVESCNGTAVGDIGELAVSAINEACDPPPAVEISSCTLVTPGVFGLIFAAFLQL